MTVLSGMITLSTKLSERTLPADDTLFASSSITGKLFEESSSAMFRNGFLLPYLCIIVALLVGTLLTRFEEKAKFVENPATTERKARQYRTSALVLANLVLENIVVLCSDVMNVM
jgi:hypothetical protein